MRPKIAIRDCRPEDAPRLAAMWRASQSVWHGGDVTASRLTTEQVLLDLRNIRRLGAFVAWAEDRPVGWCDLVLDWAEPEHAYVHVLSADPEFHGQGIGRDLLRAAFDLAMSLGYHRIYIETWAGNRRAMPLYKKMGFFWVPNTSVRMINFLPTVLRSPLVESFLQGVDWYSALRQSTQMVEDDHKREDRPVYPYVFERDGRQLRIAVDRASGEILVVEGPGFAVGLAAPARVAVGASALARCKLAADGSVSVGPGALWNVGVLVTARRVVQTQPVGVEASLELPLEADAQGSGCVHAELLVDGRELHLAAAVEVVPALSVTPQERFWSLSQGSTTSFLVDVQNNTGESQNTGLRALHDDALEIAVSGSPAEIAPGKKRSYAVEVRSRRAGAHQVRLEAFSSRLDGRSGGASVTLASPGLGQVVAYHSGDAAVLESEQARLTLDQVTGVLTIYDGRQSEKLATVHVRIGPPFMPPYAWKAGGDVVLLADRSAPEIRHTMALPEPAGIRLERRVALEAGGRIRLNVLLHNGTSEPFSPTCCLQITEEKKVQWVAIPLKHGLVHAPPLGFPDWIEGSVEPAAFAENWVAHEHDSRVLGLHWTRFDRIAMHNGFTGVALHRDCGQILPGGCCQLEPWELWVGVGDWRSARAQWYRTPAAQLRPINSLHVEPVTPLLVTGDDKARADFTIASERLQQADVRAYATATEGLHLCGEQSTLVGVSREHPAVFSVGLASAADEPGVDVVAARATSYWTEAIGQMLIIRRRGGVSRCQVEETQEAGQPLIRVDNGWTVLHIAPSFAGAVVGWEMNGHNYLHTSFPKPDVFTWFGPWYGGISPAIGLPEHQHVPGEAGLLARDSLSWERLPEVNRRGLIWSGVRLWGEPSALSWLRVEVEYLTLPGTNLLLARLKLKNRGTSTERVRAGFNAFVAPGDKRADAALHWSPDQPPYVVPRYRMHEAKGGSWQAVEGIGAAVVAVALTPETFAEGYSMGESGADLFILCKPKIEAGGAFECSTLLAVARDGTEARRYALLAGKDCL